MVVGDDHVILPTKKASFAKGQGWNLTSTLIDGNSCQH
jgi:hypothetical protein